MVTTGDDDRNVADQGRTRRTGTGSEASAALRGGAAGGGRQLLLLPLEMLFELARDFASQIRRFGQNLIELGEQISKLLGGKRLGRVRHFEVKVPERRPPVKLSKPWRSRPSRGAAPAWRQDGRQKRT